MIAWYKTRNILKEMRRREKSGSVGQRDREKHRNGNKKGNYMLMDNMDDEFK